MEVLNNIWNALCTENVGLVTIITIPLMFVEMFLMLLLFTNLLNIKSTKKQKFIYVFLASLVSIITNLFVSSPFNVICIYIILLVLIYIIFKSGLLKSIMALIIPLLVFSLVNVSILNIYIKV